jgi:hypothetical protein
VRALWPIAAVTVLFSLVVPVSSRLRRRRRDKKGDSDTYPYEFAFRLQEAADPSKIYRYLAKPRPRKVRALNLRVPASPDGAAPASNRRRKPRTRILKVTLTSRGGGRIERVSPDRALVKIHSIATFRVGWRGYARFEIVKEVLAHRVSGRPRYVIVQCRMFGDSPRALTPAEVIELLRVILQDVGVNLTGTDPEREDPEGIEVENVLDLISPLYTGEVLADTAPDSADGARGDIGEGDGVRTGKAGEEPTTVRIPAQRP